MKHGRFEALADGIFTIVMTLLVIGASGARACRRGHHTGLLEALRDEASLVLSYALSIYPSFYLLARVSLH